VAKARAATAATSRQDGAGAPGQTADIIVADRQQELVAELKHLQEALKTETLQQGILLQRAESAENQVSKLKTERDVMASKLSALSLDVERLEAFGLAQQADAAQFQDQLKKMAASKFPCSQASQTEEMEDEIQRLEALLGQAIAQLGHNAAALAEARENLVQAGRSHAQQVREMTAAFSSETAALRQHSADCDREGTVVQAELAFQESQLRAARLEVDQLKEKWKAAEAETAGVTTQLDSCRKEVTQLQGRLASIEVDTSRLRVLEEAARAQVLQLQSEIAERAASSPVLVPEEVQPENHDFDKLEKEVIVRFKEEQQSLQEEVAKLKEEHAKCKRLVAEASCQLEVLQGKEGQVQEQVIAARAELEKVEGALLQASQKHAGVLQAALQKEQELGLSICSALTQLSELQSQVEAREKQLVSIASEIGAMEMERGVKSSDAAGEADRMEAELKSLSLEHMSSLAEVEELRLQACHSMCFINVGTVCCKVSEHSVLERFYWNHRICRTCCILA
jgi:chromosome segregation ATPase